MNFGFPMDDTTLCNVPGAMSIAEASFSHGPFTIPANNGDRCPGHNPVLRRASCAAPTRVPIRNDIREWHAAQQRTERPITDTPRPGIQKSDEILNQLVVFANDVNSISTDISGIALTLAEYLAWARKNPGQCHEGILGIFEARVKEIAEISTTRTAAALRCVKEAPSNTSYFDGTLKIPETAITAIVAESQAKSEYFRSTYDIQKSLDTQRGPLEPFAY